MSKPSIQNAPERPANPQARNTHETNPAAASRQPEETYLSRWQVAERWSVSPMTVIRCEKSGALPAMRFSSRRTRYRLSDVMRCEQAAFAATATDHSPAADTHAAANQGGDL